MGGGGQGKLIRFEMLSSSELGGDPDLKRFTEGLLVDGAAADGSCKSSAPSSDCACAAASAAGVQAVSTTEARLV